MKTTITAQDRRRHQLIRKIQKYTISLPRAIDIYNYLTCYGEIQITEDDIRRHFGFEEP